MNQIEAMRLLLGDRKLAMGSLLQVDDKNRSRVPLQLNPIQSRMLADQTPRDVTVKPAQVGGSTFYIGDFLLDNLTINGTTSVIISYEEFITGRLLLKAKLFHKYLKERIPTIPDLDHKSTYELTFREPSGSRHTFFSSFYIYSARSYTLGRGETIHNLLMDEYGFWPEGTHEEIFASAVQRVPLLPNTKIRILSTPNGKDNAFYETYMAAKEGKAVKQSVYTAHCYMWYEHPEYSMTSDNPFVLQGDEVPILHNLTGDEIKLLLVFEQLGISEEEAYNKLRWRRYKRAEVQSLKRKGTTTLLFEQEYPEDDDSCFIVAGDQAHSPEVIGTKMKSCYPAPQSKSISGGRLTSATLDIWEAPREGLSYILSIDPGKAKTSESVGQVWHFEEGFTNSKGEQVPPIMKHVATLAGWYDEDEMADYCMEVGRYYNNAVICPEDNLDIVSHLKNYDELYYREDPRDGKVIRAIGWQTNVSTKPYMITELNRHLDYIESYDSRLWSQCSNIRRDRTVKTGIVVVGSTDHYMAAAIAIVCRGVTQLNRGYVGSYGWSEDWGR